MKQPGFAAALELAAVPARARTAETVKCFALSLARQVLTGHIDVIATNEHVRLLRKSGKCPRRSCPLRIQ
jgi:hypothetical protein